MALSTGSEVPAQLGGAGNWQANPPGLLPTWKDSAQYMSYVTVHVYSDFREHLKAFEESPEGTWSVVSPVLQSSRCFPEVRVTNCSLTPSSKAELT